MGVDETVTEGDCRASQNANTHLNSILKLAQDADMSTGFVTNTRVMHATPGALYANSPDRRWECESTMTQVARDQGCKDIARQLIEDEPGRNINVIMGGGRQLLISNITGTPNDPINAWACFSRDGRDLISTWRNDKAARGVGHEYVSNTAQLNNINVQNTDYVLGIIITYLLAQLYGNNFGFFNFRYICKFSFGL